MQIIRKVVPNNFNLFLTGDKHTGSRLSHDDGWEQMVNLINSEVDGVKPRNNFVVDHGDMIEAINVQDERFDFTARDLKSAQIDKQEDYAVEERNPIKRNLITILKGNHCHKLLRFRNITQKVCDSLGVQYGTVSCIIEYVDRKDAVLFKHYAHHGFGSARSIAYPEKRRQTNLKISMMTKFQNKWGDCILASMGHLHQLIICEPEPQLYLTVKDGKIKQEYTKKEFNSEEKDRIDPNLRWYVCTGSFLKTYGLGFDSYAERAGYDPVELGFVLVKIRDREIQSVEKVFLD
jgi:hypothetical protein